MSDSWFVPPETVRLELPEGQWIRVKRRLNAGEQRGLVRRLYVANDDGTLRVNPDTVATAYAIAYLVDWSLTDPTGIKVEIAQQPIEVLEGALDALDPEKFKILRDTIEGYDDRQRAAREAEKKILSSDPISPSISPSPAGSSGATSGSEILIPMST